MTKFSIENVSAYFHVSMGMTTESSIRLYEIVI